LRELGHRFPNTRAKYIVEARKHAKDLKKIVHSTFDNVDALREWLADNVKGLGFKESSHFLRNIGFEDVAIIDFHIIDFLAQLASRRCVTKTPHVLDIGCGPGRMIPEFLRLGFTVTAVDPDLDYVTEAGTLGGNGVTVRRQGFLDIDDEERYDLITAVNGPFSYLLRMDDRFEAMRRLHRSLRKDGILFLDMPNLIWILKNYAGMPQPTEAVSVEFHITRHSTHEFDLLNCVMHHHDRFEIRKGGVAVGTVEKTHSFGIIGFPELDFLLRKTGFVDVETYNSFQARQSEPLVKSRIMLSARKR
jgi:SAM-dependent methyltransferase